jgi:hypothetical protein
VILFSRTHAPSSPFCACKWFRRRETSDSRLPDFSSTYILTLRQVSVYTPGMGVIDSIRKAIRQAKVSRYQIAQDTGIHESALSRFVSGERGLSMEAVDTLCDYLGLELRPKAKRKAR